MCICGKRNCSECGPEWQYYLDAEIIKEAKRGGKENKDELQYRNSIKDKLGINRRIPLVIVCEDDHIIRLDEEIRDRKLSRKKARALKNGSIIKCGGRCKAIAKIVLLK